MILIAYYNLCYEGKTSETMTMAMIITTKFDNNSQNRDSAFFNMQHTKTTTIHVAILVPVYDGYDIMEYFLLSLYL